MILEDFIKNYGYIAILVGTFFEGETILIVAGFLAHLGYLELPFVITAAFLGTLLGDQLYFYLGRIKGKEFLDHKPRWKTKTARVLKLLDKYQTLLILGFRFIYGIRTATPFILGSIGISPLRYLILNFFGALIWAFVIGILGYYFGHTLEILVGEIKQYEKWVIAGLLLVGMAVWLGYKWREKHLAPNV